MSGGRSSVGSRARSLAVFLAATFIVQGLPTLPFREAAAQEAPPATEEEGLVPETIVQVPLPTGEDRDLEPVPIDLNTITDPEESVPSFGAGGTPDALSQGEFLESEEGSEFIDVFAESPEAGTHLAIVYPEVVNEQDHGEWVDIPLSPEPSDYGWTMQGAQQSVSFPSVLSPEAPIRYQIAQGELAFVPDGVQGAQGTSEGSSIIYEAALAHTDFVYNPAPGGYKEEVVLWSPEAGLQVAWDITATNVWLQDPGNGTIEVHSQDGPVATIATPVVYDSSEEPKIYTARYELEDLGSGAWLIGVQIPESWATSATYPLTIDPGTTDVNPLGDTYANSATGKKNTNYSSAPLLEVGPNYKSFIKFTQSWQNPQMVVYKANLKLYNTYQADPSAGVDVQRISSGWNEGEVTWNDQPSVEGGDVISAQTGPSDNWWTFELGGLYQDFVNATHPDYGVRLTTGRKTFASSAYSVTDRRPYLHVSYNNLPYAPQVAYPANNKVFTTVTPTLKIDDIPSDQDGDDVLVNYQVTDVEGDWSGVNLEQSGWTDETSFTVPAGWLEDGAQYWFRVQSRDVCTPPLGFCPNVDANSDVHEPRHSGAQGFSVALDHFGTDPSWAMWTQPLGNSMSLSVNESNGNVYLSVPIDSLQTPIGNLRVGLSYNSLKDAEGTDRGLGQGWDLHVGGAVGRGKLPVSLDELSPVPWAGVEITYRSGKTEQFPYRGGRTYAPIGAGTGTVVKDRSGGYTLTLSGGDQFTFDQDGKLETSRPVHTKTAAQGAEDPYYRYTYNASGRLTKVKDPLGREIIFSWNAQDRLASIETWVQGSTWQFNYQGGSLSQVTNPEGEQVSFSEQAVCTGAGSPELITQVKDGAHQSKPGWRVDYFQDGGTNFPLCRAAELYPPQPAGGTQHYKFSYYSSIQEFTGGRTVRDWLNGQGFKEQYVFGMRVTAQLRCM